MTSINFFSILTLVVFNYSSTLAHALFIDTHTEGIVSKVHHISIYYAEPGDSKKEEFKDWWSNSAEFILWLNRPDGTKEKLTVTKRENQFIATFIPYKDGVYFVSLHHIVESLIGNTQYEFNASSRITVGKIAQKSFLKGTGKNYEFLLYKKNHKEKIISLEMFNGGVPIIDKAITVFAPNGWQRIIKTDLAGVAIFQVDWPGMYVFEARIKEDVANEEYKFRDRIITTTLNFNLISKN